MGNIFQSVLTQILGSGTGTEGGFNCSVLTGVFDLLAQLLGGIFGGIGIG